MHPYLRHATLVGAAVLLGCGARAPHDAGDAMGVARVAGGDNTAPRDACASPRLPLSARLALTVRPHPVAHSLDDGMRRVVVVAPADAGDDRARLIIVGPVARGGRRGRSADDAYLAGLARLSYHGDTAHLCVEGAAYLYSAAGGIGPAVQGLHLDMVVDGVSLLARADIWTASASYRVVGRLAPIPVPALGYKSPTSRGSSMMVPSSRRPVVRSDVVSCPKDSLNNNFPV